jgi:hypothetical protein
VSDQEPRAADVIFGGVKPPKTFVPQIDENGWVQTSPNGGWWKPGAGAITLRPKGYDAARQGTQQPQRTADLLYGGKKSDG